MSVTINKEVATAIMNMLASQEFENWYRSLFNSWLEGDENAPADSEIIRWIITHTH